MEKKSKLDIYFQGVINSMFNQQQEENLSWIRFCDEIENCFGVKKNSFVDNEKFKKYMLCKSKNSH